MNPVLIFHTSKAELGLKRMKKSIAGGISHKVIHNKARQYIILPREFHNTFFIKVSESNACAYERKRLFDEWQGRFRRKKNYRFWIRAA